MKTLTLVLALLLLPVSLFAAGYQVQQSQTVAVTVADTTTETTLLFPGPGAGLTLHASDYVGLGHLFRFHLEGRIGTAIVLPTLRVRLRLGPAVLLDTAATTLLSISGERRWAFDAHFSVRDRDIDGVAEIMAGGAFAYDRGSGSGRVVGMVGNVEYVEMDTENLMDVTVQWGTANANNTITCEQALIEWVY